MNIDTICLRDIMKIYSLVNQPIYKLESCRENYVFQAITGEIR